MQLRILRFVAPIVPVLLLWCLSLSFARAQEDDELARWLTEVMGLYVQGKFGEALPLAERSVAVARTRHGEKGTPFATAASMLGALYQAQGRYAEAEPLHRRALAVYESTLGREHVVVTTPLNALGLLYQDQGRYADAEPLYKRSLAIKESALGREDPSVATSLNNLASLYLAQDRYADAEPLFKRSLAIRESALGREHPSVATVLNNLALLYKEQHRYAEAEPLYKRSLAISETAEGPEHPKMATTLSNLAGLYQDQRRYAEAEQLHKRSLAITERALGREHPDVASSLNNLAELYGDQGRHAEAETIHRRALAIHEAALGREHPSVATSLGNLAWLAFGRGDWAGAAGYLRRSTGILQGRAERGVAAGRGAAFGEEARRSRANFLGLVQTAYRLAAQDRSPAAGAPAAETFQTAQWALASDAAASIAQMAARSATGSPELAALVRRRQDLVSDWQVQEKLLMAAKGLEPARRNAAAEKALADSIAGIDARLTAIDGRLKTEFPDYDALARPTPASVAEVQAQLGTDEALVLFLDAPEWRLTGASTVLPEETFVWVVTRSEVRWLRSALGTKALKREVAALRCGLDNALWDDAAKSKACTSMLDGRGRADLGPHANILPFDMQRAHALYRGLLGEVEELIAGKHLLIVPSGALTQLPFQALVTVAPKTAVPGGPAGYRDAAWLGARQPITVLPAVSSLKALRAHAKASRASKPYLGIGNPLLDGDRNNDNDVARARLARTKQACAAAPIQAAPTVPVRAPVRGGVAGIAIRGVLADVAAIRNQGPLPETADELCGVAADLKADMGEMRLGTRATEAEVKRLSAGGELAMYRVLHFATHGAMAGELDKDREPGLILTPPATASEEDDGYLSASEIAALKLDADWVILSACNTAAGGAASAEALSGIARAIIYAGARALLVSHWAVYSDATVKLVARAAAAMARDARVGRAEAMRRAMLALIEKGAPHEAHPAYWAPFVVVGEGAAAR